MIDEDEEIDPQAFVEVAALTSRLMDIAVEYKTGLVVRALASCLSMTVVNTSPSREYAENLIESLADTLLGIIETMDEVGMAGWSDGDNRTLQ